MVEVRCPQCSLLLTQPNHSPVFSCPCGVVLTVPTLTMPINWNGIRERQVSWDTFKPAPVFAKDESRIDCSICSSVFSLLKRRHHCRNCGALVCGRCSNIKWPRSMLPPLYHRGNQALVRVCTKCNTSTEDFREGLLSGDLGKVTRLHSKGTIHLKTPFLKFSHCMYPIHCAAASGNIQLVQWMIDQGAFSGLTDARGMSPISVAASEGHLGLVKYMIIQQLGGIDDINDKESLKKLLTIAMFDSPPMFGSITPPPVYEKTVSSRDRIRDDDDKNLAVATTIYCANECAICFDNPVETCFVPCGHSCLCVSCSAVDDCPVCRSNIHQIIRIYQS